MNPDSPQSHDQYLQPDNNVPTHLLGDNIWILVQALEQSANSVIITDKMGSIQYVNQSFLNITGYARDEVLGRHTRILKSGIQADGFYSELWRTIESGKVWSGEFLNRKKNGELFWESASISPVTSPDGNTSHYIAIKENITRLKNAEEALSRERMQLRQIIDLVPHMIFVRDMENRFLLANKAVAHFFNLPEQQILGHTDLSLCFDKQAALRSHMQDKEIIKNQSAMVRSDIAVRRSEDDLRHFQCVKVPLNFWGENKDVVLGIMVDISRQKQNEEHLLQSRENALRASREKAFFLSVMSHEIRTPLNAILGMSRLLQNSSTDPEINENLEVLSFSAENLMDLINDILEVSRIEASSIEFEKRPLNLHHQLEQLIKAMQPKAEEKSLGLNLEIDPGIPQWVAGDSLRLGQILNNLLSNALKFTHQGEIILSASLECLSDEKVSVLFSVSDTGIGIPDYKFDSLFEPFTQAEAGTSRKYGGTGLGLTIVRQLVELQGGKITLSSRVGEGSMFSFSLVFDRIAYSPQQPMPGGLQALQVPVSANVLMIEDNVMSIILASKVFGRWEINLSIAETGAVALDKIATRKYDVILLDLQMPDMDGLHILEKIKDAYISKNSSTAVIAFTASTEASIHKQARDAGMADIVVKPYQPEDLLQKIKAHVGPKPAKGFTDCLKQYPSRLSELKSRLMLLAEIMDKPSEVILKEYKQKLQEDILPFLRLLCLESEVESVEDFLRLMGSISVQNKGLLLNSIRKGIKNQMTSYLEKINSL